MKAMVDSLWLLAVLVYAVRAEFESSPLGSPRSCSAAEIKRQCGNLREAEGLCISASGASLLWCCQPSEQHCSTPGRQCELEGPRANPTQLFCGSSQTSWCCDKRYEVCGEGGRSCVSKVDNPFWVSGKTGASAPGPDRTPTDTAETGGKGQSSPETAEGKEVLSPLAITGIVVCGLISLAAIIGSLCLLGRRFGGNGAAVERPEASGEGERPPSYEADLEKQSSVLGAPAEAHLRAVISEGFESN